MTSGWASIFGSLAHGRMLRLLVGACLALALGAILCPCRRPAQGRPLLKRIDNLEMHHVDCICTKRSQFLHAKCYSSKGEAPISRIDDFSRISLGSEVFFCYREYQVLACRDQPGIGSIAFLYNMGIGDLFKQFRAPLF